MVKTLCIVQARLTSTRLPNKVLLELGNSGKTILEHVYERLSMSGIIDKLVFAIPNTNSNDLLATFLQKNCIEYTIGDESNVLSRFLNCAERYNPEIIIRATCDNPCVDWQEIECLVEHLINNDADYVAPIGGPLGTSVEVMKYSALLLSMKEAKKPADFEHVTPYIYCNPDKFIISKINYFHKVNNSYRLTIDTIEDYQVIDIIYKHLYHGVPIKNQDIYDFLDQHPNILKINEKIEQKPL